MRKDFTAVYSLIGKRIIRSLPGPGNPLESEAQTWSEWKSLAHHEAPVSDPDLAATRKALRRRMKKKASFTRNA